MSLEAQLLDIVESYDDLPADRRKKVLAEAERRSGELGLEDFESQYDLVADIVERNRTRHHRSLDATLFSDSEFTLHDQIGEEDDELKKLLQGEEPSKRMDAERVFAVLGEHLEEDEMRILRQILARAERQITLDVFTTAIIKNIPDIKQKLHRFIERYCKDGELNIPEDATIVAVFLKPTFYIQIGDKTGSLHLSPSQKAIVLDAYETYDANAAEAARHLPHSTKTFLKYWREAGYEINVGGSVQLSARQAEQVLAAYETYDGNGVKASRQLGFCSRTTVLKYWRDAGFEIKEAAIPALSALEIERIVDAYELYEGNASQTAKHLRPHGVATIIKYWRLAGLEIGKRRGGIDSIDRDALERILAAYATSNGNASEAAKQLDNAHNVHTILKYWRRAKLEVRKAGGQSDLNRLPQEKIDKIVAAHTQFNGNAKQAAKFLQHSRSTIVQYWRRAGLQAMGTPTPNTEGRNVEVRGERIASPKIVKTKKKKIIETPEVAQAIDVLSENLPPAHIAALRLLVSQTVHRVVIGAEATALVEVADEIRLSLQRFMDRHIKDGALDIPSDTAIHSLHLRPFKVRLGSIDNPARLAPSQRQEIIDAYSTYNGNVSQVADKTSYDVHTIARVWRSENLEIERQGWKSLQTPERIQLILEAYEKYNRSAKEAEKHLKFCSRTTILKHWKEAGYEVVWGSRPRGGSTATTSRPKRQKRNAEERTESGDQTQNGNAVSTEQKQQILDAYAQYNGNASETARQLKFCSKTTVVRYWREAGFEIIGKRLPQEEVQKILAAHTEYFGNALRASAALGYAYPTVSKYWEEAELVKPLAHPRPTLTDEDKEEIIAEYEPSGGNAREACRRLTRFSLGTILRQWKRASLEVGKQGVNQPKK